MPDSVPNYLTTDAAGNVGAQFTGGLDLLADVAVPQVTPLAEKSIRWHRTTINGAVVAAISAGADNTDADLQIVVRDPNGGPNFAGVRYFADNVESSVFTYASMGGSRALIKSDDRSDFLQIDSSGGKKSITGEATIIWNGVATQAIVAIPNIAFGLAHPNNFACVATPRFLPGDSTGGQFCVNTENFNVNQMIIRVFAMGFVPPAGVTHIDYILWEK